jgi:hypothetical protein
MSAVETSMSDAESQVDKPQGDGPQIKTLAKHLSLDNIIGLPLRVFCLGLAVLLLVVFGVWILVYLLKLDLSTFAPKQEWLTLMVGVLVFLTGIAIAVFLWWLSARFFGLIDGNKLDGSALAAIKDLPMGLPEGTVRAVLALIVAVIGIPLLLFSNLLHLNDAIAGYINGIVTGVFAFYFGTRAAAGGVTAQTVDKIAGAQAEAIAKSREAADSKADALSAQSAADAANAQAAQAQGEAQSAKDEAQTAKTEADSLRTEAQTARDEATLQSQRVQAVANFDTTLNTAARHIELAKTILQVFGPALPQGLLPPQAAGVLDSVQKTVAALQGVSASNATKDQADALAQAATAITGKDSPLATLFNTAAPLLTTVLPIPALGPAAALAALLGLGVKLGSSQFQRWRARVLAAPLAQGLVEFGTVTPELMHAAIRKAPLLQSTLQRASDKGIDVDSFLANIISSPQAAQALFSAFGPSGARLAGLIKSEDDAECGLAQLQQAVLALYSENDVQDSAVRDVANTLAGAVHPELSEATVQATLKSVGGSEFNQLIDAVSGLSARHDADEKQRAAFDALVTLVDTARRQQIDLTAAIAELHE